MLILLEGGHCNNGLKHGVERVGRNLPVKAEGLKHFKEPDYIHVGLNGGELVVLE